MGKSESAPLDFSNAAAWRRWLARNHDRSDGEWVYMYKKDADRTGLRYPEALDEALGYGWIDGQVKAVDRNHFRQRWTPRRKNSTWSEVNRRKVRQLIVAGRMAEPGLAAVRAAKRDGRWAGQRSENRRVIVIPALRDALAADALARRNFRAFAPSYRRMYAAWVADAKTEATRLRRIDAVVRRARENRKPYIDGLYN